MHQYTIKESNRFWNKVGFANDNRCWEWQAGLYKNGYGKFRVGEKIAYSHRVAWELMYGEIPNELWVLHSCDNPACCNPKHLFLGTPRDNTQDKMNKGRGNFAKGERASGSKLTEKQVLFIRQKYKNGSTCQQLAKMMKISISNIWHIVNRKTWKDI